MEKQKLPNQTAIMILGITSFIGCCCTNGILGLILAGIGLHLAKKDEKMHAENPDIYDLGSLKTWKTIKVYFLLKLSPYLKKNLKLEQLSLNLSFLK